MKSRIISLNVDIFKNMDEVVNSIFNVYQVNSSGYVCVANVHMCMEAYDDKSFQACVNSADFVVPDGRPLVWVQRLVYDKNCSQVRGMDLTNCICEKAEQTGYSVGFYGSTPAVLWDLELNLVKKFPKLKVRLLKAPPFGHMSEQEIEADLSEINFAGVDILFVGLGCPKQEIWMCKNKNRLNCIMIGVGAAFDFIAKRKRHAPHWMQLLGLEWFFRLVLEPRRLWRRYLILNTRFIYNMFLQIVGKKYD